MEIIKDLGNTDGKLCEKTKSLNVATEVWRMVVRGVKNDQRNKIRPSDEDVLAVHSRLKVLSQLLTENFNNRSSKPNIEFAWLMIEIVLEELRPIILASTFYKISCPFNIDEKSFLNDQCKISSLNGGLLEGEVPVKWDAESNLGPIKGAGSVSPITYLFAIWLAFAVKNKMDDIKREVYFSKIQTLSNASSVGFTSMANFQGKALILKWLKTFVESGNKSQRADLKLVHSEAEMISSVDRDNCLFLLDVWKIISEGLRTFIESTNDVPSIEGGPRDSGYSVVFSMLMLPLKLCLHLSTKHTELQNVNASSEFHEKCRKDLSRAKVEVVNNCWMNIFDSVSRIASLKRSRYFVARCMFQWYKAILDGICHDNKLGKGTNVQTLKLSSEFLELLSTAIVSALKQVEIPSQGAAASRHKRRSTMNPSGGYLHGTAMIIADPCNMKDILLTVVRFLSASRLEYLLNMEFPNDVVIRVLEALTSLIYCVHTRYEALLLLQVMSSSLAYWISTGQSTMKPGSIGKSLAVPLQEQLGRAWKGLLVCLQTSQPSITFDSNLLAVHAVSLSRFLSHDDINILNCTLSFWEATYGRKTTRLKYPSCIIPVLRSLRRRVKITLPGWKHDLPESGQKHNPAKMTLSGGRKEDREDNSVADISADQFQASPLLQLPPQPSWQVSTLLPQQAHAVGRPVDNPNQGAKSGSHHQRVAATSAAADNHKLLICDRTSQQMCLESSSALQMGLDCPDSNSEESSNFSTETAMSNSHGSNALGMLVLRMDTVDMRFPELISSSVVVPDLEHDKIPTGRVAETIRCDQEGQEGIRNGGNEAENAHEFIRCRGGSGLETAELAAVDAQFYPEKSASAELFDNRESGHEHCSTKENLVDPVQGLRTNSLAASIQALSNHTRTSGGQERNCEDAVLVGIKNSIQKCDLPKKQCSLPKKDNQASEPV